MSISAFTSPILGMLTQSQSFSAISQNITNMNTGGYKAADTRFSTVLAQTFSNNHDVGGVLALNKNNISTQGNIVTTTNALDLAINGNGMFVVNPKVDGSGETLYTRDGAFSTQKNGTASVTITNSDNTTSSYTTDKGYLVDKNGYYVQAWTPDATGKFSTSSALSSVRIDNAAFSSEAAATTTAYLGGNLPAVSNSGDQKTMRASAYTSDGTLKTFELIWTRQTAAQTWNLRVRSDQEVSASDQDTTIDGTTSTPTVGSEATYVFDSTGHLTSGTAQDLTINYTDGKSLSFSLDLTDQTSIGSTFSYDQFDKDGRGPGQLNSFTFDDQGQILGTFSNGVQRALYKLPIATFVNADGLELRQGNLFATSSTSGSAVLRQVQDPAVVASGNNQQKTEFATFVPFAHELSNVNLESEFSRMIMTQKAYNMSATVFKTVDEMVKTASDLKS